MGKGKENLLSRTAPSPGESRDLTNIITLIFLSPWAGPLLEKKPLTIFVPFSIIHSVVPQIWPKLLFSHALRKWNMQSSYLGSGWGGGQIECIIGDSKIEKKRQTRVGTNQCFSPRGQANILLPSSSRISYKFKTFKITNFRYSQRK